MCLSLGITPLETALRCPPAPWWVPLSVPPDTSPPKGPLYQRTAFWLPVVLSQWAVLPGRQGTVGLALCPPLLWGMAAPLCRRSQVLPGSSFHLALCVQVPEAAGSLVPPAPAGKVPSCGQWRVPRHLGLLPSPCLLLCEKSLCYTPQGPRWRVPSASFQTLSNACALQGPSGNSRGGQE